MLLAKFIHINMDKNKRPKLYTLPDTLGRQSSPAAVPIAPRVLSGIECRPVQRVQRPGVCRCVALPALHLARPAMLPVLLSRPGALGAGSGHRWGIQGEPGVGWSTPRVEKIQKRRFPCIPTPSFLCKSPHPILPISKISRKNKKTPTKGLCFVLYLPYKS